MATYKPVSCVTKPNRESKHEYITHIGGSGTAGRWLITREEAIRQIDLGETVFYTVDPHNSKNVAIVCVVRPKYGHPYLRTWADGDWKDNLLSLNECPLR